MRPGQLEPNEFELALLSAIASQDPSLADSFGQLRVLSREFTGVGCFTRFQCGAAPGTQARHISLEGLIRIPGVQSGMGAVLFCKGNHPDYLEVFTFGNEHWDGVYEGFFIETTV